MQTFLPYLFLLILFYVLEASYFCIANKYNIIDTPNYRSSHTTTTIRGGGILFPIAIFIWYFQWGFSYPLFVAGLLVISLISFIDDIKPLKSGLRTIFQIIAVEFSLLELPLQIDWYWYPLLFIIIVGTKNAYNFMDGINGITGAYSLITLLTLWYINRFVAEFTFTSLLLVVILALVIFNFFNFRSKAKCFAGDVGSVSMAFIVLFLMMQLIIDTRNYIYIILLLVYGLDTVTTIFFRLIRRENILQAHRTHFYQFLANEKKWPHLKVAALYSLIQLFFNLIVVVYANGKGAVYNNFIVFVFVFVSGILFVSVRFFVEGNSRLLKKTAAV